MRGLAGLGGWALALGLWKAKRAAGGGGGDQSEGLARQGPLGWGACEARVGAGGPGLGFPPGVAC